MNFDQSNLIVTSLLVILGLSVLVAVIIITKTFANEAREKKAKAARLAAEEQKLANEKKVRTRPKPKVVPAPAKKQKDDVSEDDDLVAAAEVYLTYELKEQAITSLEKHLLTNPTDKRALALLKKAEASG
ncbi:MAG: hypothetical protein RQ936_10880 [Gammaproteobacteria bacterium]|nr:hypothetical protein [Gammaproteobacteria bacterium]